MSAVEHQDVLIVGGGISGIDAAYHLQKECPERTFTILERREQLGGTWDLFRYPGIRSDSDIYTFSFPFRAWRRAENIAPGEAIREYIDDTADEIGVRDRIRFGTKVIAADFDSSTDQWTVQTESDGGPKVYTARFLFLCTGYYNYDAGHNPEFVGSEDFSGTVVHPQFWPEDLDYTDKRVVVIGSGATAMTLIPSMASDAKSVTMLQRSPTYVGSLPLVDVSANLTKAVLPESIAHNLLRWRNALANLAFYQLCRNAPGTMKKLLRAQTARALPEGYPVDVHFNPRYNPWDQRFCVVPNGDLFRAIKAGRAEIVTDTVERFTEKGVATGSGEVLEADIIVTATGLKVQAFGGIDLSVDGVEVKPHELFAYRGHMFDGLPNLAWTVGYTNASWTLRADLVSRAVTRLLNHMSANGYTRAQPTRGDDAADSVPIIDLEAGYVLRSLGQLPQAGSRRPWAVKQNFVIDYVDSWTNKVDDSMRFS